jgi:hypothetical protein
LTGTLPVANGGTGLTTIGANQTLIGTSGGLFNAGDVPTRLIAYSTALALTASGDQLLTMNNSVNLGNYIVRRVTWGLPLTSALATVITVATLRTAINGGGSAITGALVVTGLSATTAFLDQVVTLASGISTSTQLVVQVTTLASTAPNSQIFVYADLLGV